MITPPSPPQFILAATLGRDWPACFDLLLYNATKPALFALHGPSPARPLPLCAANVGGEESSEALTEVALPVAAHGPHDGAALRSRPASPDASGVDGAGKRDSGAATRVLLACCGGHISVIQRLANEAEALGARLRHRERLHAPHRPAATHSSPAAPGKCAASHAPACAPSAHWVRVKLRPDGAALGVLASDGVHHEWHDAAAHASEAAGAALVGRVPHADAPLARSLTDETAAGRADVGAPSAARGAPALGERDVDVGPVPPAPRARILFWGDHIHQEVVPASLEAGLHSVAVLEELECEAPHDVGDITAAGGGLVVLGGAGTAGARVPGMGVSVWGGFFCQHGGSEGSEGSGGGERAETGWVSWWSPLVARHAVMAVSDVEAALVALVGE